MPKKKAGYLHILVCVHKEEEESRWFEHQAIKEECLWVNKSKWGEVLRMHMEGGGGQKAHVNNCNYEQSIGKGF